MKTVSLGTTAAMCSKGRKTQLKRFSQTSQGFDQLRDLRKNNRVRVCNVVTGFEIASG